MATVEWQNVQLTVMWDDAGGGYSGTTARLSSATSERRMSSRYQPSPPAATKGRPHQQQRHVTSNAGRPAFATGRPSATR